MRVGVGGRSDQVVSAQFKSELGGVPGSKEGGGL